MTSPHAGADRGDGGSNLAAGGAIAAALLVSARGGAILTAVLVLPLTIPTLIFGAAPRCVLLRESPAAELALQAAFMLLALALCRWQPRLH